MIYMPMVPKVLFHESKSQRHALSVINRLISDRVNLRLQLKFHTVVNTIP